MENKKLKEYLDVNSRMMQHSTLLSQIHRTEKYMYRMS